MQQKLLQYRVKLRKFDVSQDNIIEHFFYSPFQVLFSCIFIIKTVIFVLIYNFLRVRGKIHFV